MPKESDVTQFLQTLYPDGLSAIGDGDRNYWMLIWALPGKESHWCTTIDGTTTTLITALAKRKDVYIGCGLAPHDYGAKLRCVAKEIVGIPGLWLDIDFGPGHKKKGLPPTQEDAETLLTMLGPTPTMVIHSGHGLQAWWVFKEPWIFDSDKERTNAAALTDSWNKTAMARAKERGWVVDNVGDLSRVMRIPGTWNHKSVPVETSLLRCSEYHWNAQDFDSYLIAATSTPHVSVGNLTWSYTLSPGANPPPEKFHVLMENDPKFKALWRHKRDLPSESEYDLGLATLAMTARWSDQEVVDLLIAHRRKYSADLKIERGAENCYYRMTLNKAAQGTVVVEEDAMLEYFQEHGELPAEVKEDPAAIKTTISKDLGLTITKLIKWCCEPPVYDLEVNGEMVRLGGCDNLWFQSYFDRIVWDATGIVPIEHKPAKWKLIRKMLMEIRVNEDVSPEANTGESLRLWLDQWIKDVGSTDPENWERFCKINKPYTKDGQIYFTLIGLRNYLDVTTRDKLSAKDLAVRLRTLGMVSKGENVSVKGDSGKRTQKQVWLYCEKNW